MHILRGKTALSEFRISKLLAALQQKVSGVEHLDCQFIHFIHSRDKLDKNGINQLNAILLGTERNNIPPETRSNRSTILVTPRPGTISPWSSKFMRRSWIVNVELLGPAATAALAIVTLGVSRHWFLVR